MFSQEPLLSPRGGKTARLRELIASGRTVMAPGAFNGISAKLAEQAGYELLYISGAGLNNGVAGYPDIGMLTLPEFTQFAGYIARAVNIPAIADADTGFGEAINVYRTVQEFERAGVAGIHIEDQVFPKRCGHLQGKAVISKDAMVEKIKAAVEARQDPDFLIIARVDSLSQHGFADALERAQAYVAAGADMIFPEALTTAEHFQTFAKELGAPLLANMTEFGKTPYLTIQEFTEFGYNIVIYPMTAFRVMMKAVQEAYLQLKAEGTQSGFLDRMVDRRALYELIHYGDYEALDSVLVEGGKGSAV